MSNRNLFILLLFTFVIRLIVSNELPLMDTSEARYAEMARKMVATGNWVTPMFTETEPFWGKPPLSFWSQAASISVFGEAEWVSRFPSFIFHILCCYLIFLFLKNQGGARHGLIASLMYSTTALGFMASGVVLTDPVLNFSVLLSFFGFWQFISSNKKRYAYIGFAGLGLGLLAKGPIAVVLFSVPIAFWIALNNRWGLLKTIPWLSGIGVSLIIALPWYVIAEQATPGFIDYFIVGEHFNRYLVSDWAGDRYGDAHARPLGTIWFFLLFALFPWVFYGLVPNTWRAMNHATDRSWKTFLWSWALVTPVFFTMAGNILWTYLLPCLVPWMILLSYRFTVEKVNKGDFAIASLAVPLVMLILSFNDQIISKSMNQKPVVEYWKQSQSDESLPLFYFYKRLYSGEYYSAGEALHVTEVANLPIDKPFYLALRLKDLNRKAIPFGLDCEHDSGPKVINETALFKCERAL